MIKQLTLKDCKYPNATWWGIPIKQIHVGDDVLTNFIETMNIDLVMSATCRTSIAIEDTNGDIHTPDITIIAEISTLPSIPEVEFKCEGVGFLYTELGVIEDEMVLTNVQEYPDSLLCEIQYLDELELNK